MRDYKICQITKDRIEEVEDMLAPEIVALIKRDLPVTALAVVLDEKIVGALGGLIDTDTFIIVSMYVLPEDRRKGAGTALMKKLFELADAEDLMVRAEYTAIDSEDTIAPFLTSMDFEETDDTFPISIVNPIEDFLLDAKSLPLGMAEIMTFAEAGDDKVRAAFDRLKEQDGIHVEMDKLENQIDKNISFIAIEKGEFRGCVLGERLSRDVIRLSILWALEADVKNATLMISFALEEIRKTASPKTKIVIPVQDPETQQVVSKILETPTQATRSFFKTRFVEI